MQTYNGGEAIKPIVIDGLTEGTDYVVTYENNVNAGTATAKITGIGNYAGSEVEKTFTIQPATLPEIGAIAVQTYNGGEAIKPIVINGLTEDKDYKVVYTNNTGVGTATATITGIGNYAGTVIVTFNIAPATEPGPQMVTPQTEAEAKPAGKTAPAEVVVSDGYGHARPYDMYNAASEALQDSIRMYHATTVDEAIDWEAMQPDEILLRLTRILHLRAERIAAFRKAGVQWIVFIMDDAVLVIPVTALADGADYEFILEPDLQQEERYHAAMRVNGMERDELPSDTLAGLAARDGMPVDAMLFLPEGTTDETALETRPLTLSFIDEDDLDQTMTAYVMPVEVRCSFRDGTNSET